jgi:hypothetical protein
VSCRTEQNCLLCWRSNLTSSHFIRSPIRAPQTFCWLRAGNACPPPMPIAFIAPSDLAPRGVYVAHCLSQHGYMILFAVDHNHCLLPRERGSVREVQPEENPVAVHEELMRLLEELDPVPVASQGNGFGAASLLLPLLAFI